MRINKSFFLAVLFPLWFLASLWYGHFEFNRDFSTSIVIFWLAPTLASIGYNVGKLLDLK